MTDDEVRDFLDQERTVVLATIGRDGWPHSMPLSYVIRGGSLWAWTYAKSQKAVNLRRDSRATLLVEAGRDYGELRGVMMKVATVLHRDPAVVDAFIVDLAERYEDTMNVNLESLRSQIPRRVVLEFTERSRVTWDHRKLPRGVY